MEHQIREIEEFTVRGIETVTTNQQEMDPKSAKIPALWEKFEQQNASDSVRDPDANSCVYGVYYDFKNRDQGEYRLLIGNKIEPEEMSNQNADLKQVAVQPGKYLVFTGRGKLPNVVFATWEKIWNYFNQTPQYRRAFQTDFEKYDSSEQSKIEIFISIH